MYFQPFLSVYSVYLCLTEREATIVCIVQRRSNYTRTAVPSLHCRLVHKSATAAPCRQVLGKACGNVNITGGSVVINTRYVPQVQSRSGCNLCVNQVVRVSVYEYSNTCFHIRTVHRDIIKVLYSPTNAQVIVLKTILKFTLI